MFTFLLGIAILCVGYFTYGKLIEKILGPDERDTPAVALKDDVDFLVLPNWRNMLIQLLNIAGVGPVIGVILGCKFGAIVFLIIPIGNIIGGAVHDFIGGFMSMRYKGANLPKLIKMMLGAGYYRIFSVFVCILLLLVVAVFINVPAELLKVTVLKSDCFTKFLADMGVNNIPLAVFWAAVALIFVYYICATLFPVDKVIGMVYPFFGMLLLIGSCALFVMLIIAGCKEPSLFLESAAFKAGMIRQPIVPVLFVTIACGIISGFHATQSPIIARTMKSEKFARRDFYGMMVLEGIIAMIWAAGGIAIYNLFPALMKMNPNYVLERITTYFLGNAMGIITVIAVIVLAVTSGDTALRSLRLSVAEMFNVGQSKFINRVLLLLPMIVIITLLLAWSAKDAQSFGNIWSYFAWGNQVLAASTLLAGAVYLQMQKKNSFVALFPGLFMTFIVVCYILWVSPANTGTNGPWGLGIGLKYAYLHAVEISLFVGWIVILRGRKLAENGLDEEFKKEFEA